MLKFNLPNPCKIVHWLTVSCSILLTLIIGINIGYFANGNGNTTKMVLSAVDAGIIVINLFTMRMNLRNAYNEGVLDGRKKELLDRYAAGRVIEETDI